MIRFLSAFILTLATAQAAVRADAAFERVAYRLELVRNQVELTIANHRTLASDVRKQERELEGMRVYDHVPLAKNDFKNDRKLLDSIAGDFRHAAELDTGYDVKKIELVSKWEKAPGEIPAEVSFDSQYQVPANLVVDRREVRFVLRFKSALPLNPTQWFGRQQNNIARLVTPLHWTHAGKRPLVLKGVGTIYRYRDFDYPKLVVPDLARYSTPSNPESVSQKSSLERIERYRRDIMKMWPAAQPYVDDIRKFARNDLRMNFFLEHANVREE